MPCQQEDIMMHFIRCGSALAVVALAAALWQPQPSAAAAVKPMAGMQTGDIEVSAQERKGNRNVNRNTNVNRNPNVNQNVNRRTTVVVRPVRVWAPRPYYGTVIAGVALGTIVTAAAVGVAPAAPAANMCWFWADPAMTRGYWDYCTPP
jgi:hypothetical protein